MKHKRSVPQKRQERRSVLARILDTPHLEHVVPRLQPDLLHRVIQSCGLEDCGELVMLTTPEQLTRIFDLDLWRPAEPGMDEQFDAERFGIWLEVLAECDAGMAAQKLAQIDVEVVVAGLSQHARVFDCAVVTPYRTTDGIEFAGIRETGELACDIGGYRLVAKRTDSWQAIVEILVSLDTEHPDYFHQVMRGCRALSNSGPERDGLDDLFAEDHQAMFDLAFDRERRRDQQGYVTPGQARAFLQMSRQLQLGSGTIPHPNPIAGAYLRSIDQAAAYTAAGDLPASSQPVPSVDHSEAAAALADVLLEAGIIGQQPRALLTGSQDQTSALRHIRAHMQFVFDCAPTAYSRRNEELTYIANTIMAGCSLQGRVFTTQEAWDAAAAICNLGLENWPPRWISAKSLPDNFLAKHDLVTVFQVGWTVLHKDAGMYAAEHLVQVLAGLRCNDRDVQTALDTLRRKLATCCRTGMPWRARDEMEVLAILDTPAWAALLGLIDECPVLHAALKASRRPRTHSISPSAFEFISENSQIASIREFIQSLPETLCLSPGL
jgi:hypothetical protein